LGGIDELNRVEYHNLNNRATGCNPHDGEPACNLAILAVGMPFLQLEHLPNDQENPVYFRVLLDKLLLSPTVAVKNPPIFCFLSLTSHFI
jgi:hypothetical protein